MVPENVERILQMPGRDQGNVPEEVSFINTSMLRGMPLNGINGLMLFSFS